MISRWLEREIAGSLLGGPSKATVVTIFLGCLATAAGIGAGIFAVIQLVRSL